MSARKRPEFTVNDTNQNLHSSWLFYFICARAAVRTHNICTILFNTVENGVLGARNHLHLFSLSPLKHVWPLNCNSWSTFLLQSSSSHQLACSKSNLGRCSVTGKEATGVYVCVCVCTSRCWICSFSSLFSSCSVFRAISSSGPKQWVIGQRAADQPSAACLATIFSTLFSERPKGGAAHSRGQSVRPDTHYSKTSATFRLLEDSDHSSVWHFQAAKSENWARKATWQEVCAHDQWKRHRNTSSWQKDSCKEKCRSLHQRRCHPVLEGCNPAGFSLLPAEMLCWKQTLHTLPIFGSRSIATRCSDAPFNMRKKVTWLPKEASWRHRRSGGTDWNELRWNDLGLN